MTREWVVGAYDGVEGLRLQYCDPETPGTRDGHLRIEAFALNWGDDDVMRDRYSFSFSALPARVGIDAVGIVEAVGSEVEGIETGARDCTLRYFYDRRGASADTLRIDQAYVTLAPKGLSAVEAASVWMELMTAYFPIVELAKAALGRVMFIPAGSSTAGNAAIRIGMMKGATVVSTTRSDANRAYLQDSGADNVFLDDGGDISAYLHEVTNGHGAGAAFDPVGGDFTERSAPAMAKDGIVFLCGGLSGTYSLPPFLAMIQRSLWFHPYSLFNYVEVAEVCARGKAFVYDSLGSGALTPNIDRVFPIEGYVDGWRDLRGHPASHGKVVIETGA